MRTLFLLLISCLPCFAQFGVEQPMFQVTSETQVLSPTNITGLRYWWQSSNVGSTNQVMLWPDSKSNAPMYQLNAPWTPEKIENYIHFDAADRMLIIPKTATNGLDSISMMIIASVPANPGPPSDYKFIEDTTNAVNFRFGLQSQFAYSRDAIVLNAGITNNGTDILFMVVNGVVSNATFYSRQGTLPLLTVSGITNYSPTSVDFLPSGAVFDWYEIAIWTNHAITYAEAVGLDRYRTNRYGYYPNVAAYSMLASYDINALGLSDGSTISSVPDGGPNGYALASGGTDAPYWTNNAGVINNQGAAYFDGTDDRLTNYFNVVWPQPTHVFVVASCSGTAGNAALFGARSSPNQQTAIEVGNNGIQTFSAGTTVSPSAIPMENWTVWEFLFDASRSYIKTNNVTLVSGDAGANGRQNIVLGNSGAVNAPFAGWIAYASFYTNSLSMVSASNVVQTLGTRYGITTYTRN